jgi:hypothetical protein
MTDVEEFCRVRGLEEHTDLFVRAALVARNPNDFANIPEVGPEEQTALAFERDHKFKGTFWLWFSVIMCAVGAA